jgi:hypothetical protein
MKKVNFKVCMMLLAASSFVACNDNDDNKVETAGKAKMVLALDMGVNGSQLTYIVPVAEELLNGGTVSLDNAYEGYQGTYAEACKNWVFCPSIGESAIKRYARQDDGTLLLDGSIETGSTAAFAVMNMLVVSDTKAYATLLLANKIFVFNPTTMTKITEIDLAKPEYGVNGTSTPNPAGLVYRDGKVFAGCLQITNLPLCANGAYVIVIDEATDTPEKMIADTRGSAASYYNNEMFTDEKGDIYVNCFASYGYVPGQVGGFLRIKKGATDFDPDYFFNITNRPIDGIEGGYLMSAVSSHYMANGIAYMFGTNPAYASQPNMDYVNDRVIESFKIDLYNQTVTHLNLPRSNPYSNSICHIGDMVYFGLTTESQGAGLFSYNHRTGETSSAPVLNAPGTVLDAAVFE